MMKGSLQRIFLALDVLQNLRDIAENRIGRPTEKMNRDSQRLQVEHEESLREIKEQISHEKQQLTEKHLKLLRSRKSQNQKELSGSVKDIQDRFDSEAKQLITEIKRLEIDLREARWLAEAVIEENQKKLHREREQEKKAIKDVTAELLNSKSELDELLKKTMFSASTSEPSTSRLDIVDGEEYQAKIRDAVHEAKKLGRAKLPRLFRGFGPSISLVMMASIVAVLCWIVGKSIPVALSAGLLTIAAPILIGLPATKRWSDLSTDLIDRMTRLAMSESQLESQLNEKWAKSAEELRQQEWETPNEIERRLHDARQKNDALLEQARESARSNAREAHDTLSPKLESELQALEEQTERESFALRERHAKIEQAEHRRYREVLQKLTAKTEDLESEIMAEWDSDAEKFLQLIEHPDHKALIQFSNSKSDFSKAQQTEISTNLPSELFLGFVKPTAFQTIYDSDSDLLRSILQPSVMIPVGISLVHPELVVTRSAQASRSEAIEFHKRLMLQALTTIAPGKVRFTCIDPVGLGDTLSDFMHLADFDPRLITDRIWTEKSHIERVLADTVTHMENVIQKYLRNDYESIQDYNRDAGEIAEPFRFIVINDFPRGFSEAALESLSSVITSGARCGVYVILHLDQNLKLPEKFDSSLLENHSSIFQVQDNTVFAIGPNRSSIELTSEPLPQPHQITTLMKEIGQSAIDASRVEVPFSAVKPSEIWSQTCDDELVIPLGRSGAKNLLSIRLGRGTSQHALIAGRTGSGKSTLLHVLISNAALWYSPEELQLFLVDFKKGVEFKTYASLDLPHANAVAVESDREFGLSLLQRIDEELSQRGDTFRKLGVQNLPGYRSLTDQPAMPRILLIIDEFQELFVEDDRLAQEASLLLDRIVRQGRAFGVHAIMGSQTLGGAYALAKSTMSQMQIRIALQCSESDSYLILGEDNGAARLLGRPGEAIYNDAGGAISANTPFQIVWLGDEERDAELSQLQRHAKGAFTRDEPMVVFEGSAPVHIENSTAINEASPLAGPHIWLGEPVAIRGPVGLPIKRQGGANLLIVGQQPETALGLISAAVESLARTLPESTPERLVVVDGTPLEDPLTGHLDKVATNYPEVSVKSWREAEDAVALFHHELKERLANGKENDPTRVLILHGLQRFRGLRTVEDFSFTASEGPPTPDKQFEELLRDGPTVGLHVITWCDSVTNLNRTIARGTLRDFELKVLLQMSAADSSLLVDAPAAAQLGGARALLSIEETNQLEKFRPYRLRDS
jgi:S-DNA-T family DNA segregation ATPase FtsK/SpoIIIE